ncbi:MucB/RseB C-terminal domain-containing protein [Caldimonas brevitalea]|uniref:Sigma E regulatory protein, MucB/RseB n=1 Tax=Caldimonas brevitalea TaxID=413882 RepID=A0A0G3BUU6_9BURK|nr:MucB/RseB C-terminal domain-containing protein [Caldimonas brevitalea]AKJ31161.1 sigma E regulatory protein, MucB/RseB [Caldimonas brevitalea]
MMGMQARRWFAPWWGLGMMAFISFGALAQAATDAPLDRVEVRNWLLRIHEAAQRRNFQGTFVVSAGGQVASSRIAHFCDGANQFERIESLDGQMRRVYRHNDLVATLWPGPRVAVVEHRETLSTFPALLHTDGDRLSDHYEVHRQGSERVAGHEAEVLLVRPRDHYRYGYRLWSEKQSGLLLRAEVLGRGTEVLESSAFSDVAIGVKSQPETVVQPMKRLEGYRVDRPTLSKTDYEQEGWVYKQKVAGFRHVNCVKRALGASAASAPGGPPPQLLQTIFSDGLAHVSIFVEPYDAGRHGTETLMSMGATQTLTRRHGDWWVTAVGEVPPATLRMFVQGLERKK